MSLLLLLLPLLPLTLTAPLAPLGPPSHPSYLSQPLALPLATCKTSSPPTPPYTDATPLYLPSMQTCLSALNTQSWDGVHCVLSENATASSSFIPGSDTPVSGAKPGLLTGAAPVSQMVHRREGEGKGEGKGEGEVERRAEALFAKDELPTFGFWKGQKGMEDVHMDGLDCYKACEACLKGAIEGGGGSVRCDWFPSLSGGKETCWMGFDEGK